MRFINGSILVASLLLVPAPALLAQTTVDPSGHWTGAIHIPAYNGASPRELGIDVDIAKTAGGGLEATFGQPAQNIKGLPLGKVSLDGASISFELKANGGGRFRGTVADAKRSPASSSPPKAALRFRSISRAPATRRSRRRRRARRSARSSRAAGTERSRSTARRNGWC